MGERNSFIRSVIILIAFLFLEGISIMLISRNSIIQRYRIMEAIHTVRNIFTSGNNSITYYFSLRKVNEELIEENTRLHEDVYRLKSVIQDQGDSLRYLGSEFPYHFIPAMVVGNSTDKQHNVIIINKGSEDGIEEDMGVMTSRGVIGYVSGVYKHYSRVESLLDVDQSLSALIKSNGTFGSVKWDGIRIDRTIMHDIPVHTEIVVGDTVVTSGYSFIFPAGIPIGTIESAEIKDGINYDVTLSLLENYSSLQYVYVVKNIGKEELQ